jgi:hypothetical protein
MILTEAVRKKIKDRSHVRLDDIFGQARIRKTMYEYECLRQSKNEKIRYLEWIIDGQGEAITRMIDKINELENENAELRQKLGEEVG